MTVYSKFITLKNGRRIYAAQYGLKAFCFEVDSTKKNADNEDTDDVNQQAE